MNQVAKFFVFPKNVMDFGKNPKLDFIKYFKLHGRLLFTKYFIPMRIDTASSSLNVCTTD